MIVGKRAVTQTYQIVQLAEEAQAASERGRRVDSLQSGKHQPFYHIK